MVAGAAMWKVAGVSGWAAASATPAPTQLMTAVRHEPARSAQAEHASSMACVATIASRSGAIHVSTTGLPKAVPCFSASSGALQNCR